MAPIGQMKVGKMKQWRGKRIEAWNILTTHLKNESGVRRAKTKGGKERSRGKLDCKSQGEQITPSHHTISHPTLHPLIDNCSKTSWNEPRSHLYLKKPRKLSHKGMVQGCI
jgi:hypothetical protein